MAQLPGETWLIQQIDGEVHLFHRDTQETIVKYDVLDTNAMAKAQKVISVATKLNLEERSFAHFWCGYFYAYACMGE